MPDNQSAVPVSQRARDVGAIRDHAARILERMRATPYGPKRKRLAGQSVDLTNEALRAEGWNAAIAECTAEVDALRAEVRREVINTPETADFMVGVPLEAAHQRERWAADHDAGKTPFDWFWLIGYLAQKAADASARGDTEKAKHHTISTAAALANWHAALTGASTAMRPGIDPAALTDATNRGEG